MSHVWADVRYAVRRSLARKWVSAAILVAIALGSGATAALFTIVDRILLRPLPVAEPDRAYWIRVNDGGNVHPRINPGDAFDLRTRSQSFAAVASYNEGEATIRVGNDDVPERVRLAFVEAGMLDALGFTPMLGKFFSADDYAAVSPNTIITHRLWQRAFGRDPQVIGRTVYLNNVARTVIGVLPPAADMLPDADFEIWRPLLDNPQQRSQGRTASFLVAVARLKPGVPEAAAQADVDRIARQLGGEHPLTNGSRSFQLQLLQDGVVGSARPTFSLLGGAALGILLIACSSVANLLVARSHQRAHELSIRAALGGRTRRLVQQVLTETSLLCAVGGGAGLLLAPVLLKGFVRLYPGGVPRVGELAPDFRTLAVALCAIVMAGLLASLPVIRQTITLDLLRQLRGDTRAIGKHGDRRFAGALVIGQLGLSIVLLFGGALLLETYRNLSKLDPGFDTEHVLSFDVTPSQARYPTTELLDTYYDRLIERIQAIPGVRAAGAGNLIPFAPGNLSEGYQLDGRNDVGPNQPFAKMQIVSDDYIAAIGLSLVRGRAIVRSDRDSTPPVVVINEALARQQFPGEDPISRRLTLRGSVWEIVGIVSDKYHTSLKEAPLPELYISRRQLQRQFTAWVVMRSSGAPEALVPAVRAIVQDLDPTVAFAHLATMQERRFAAIAPEQFRAATVGGFAVLALLLATIGLYGVVSYTVSQRTREIGIRVALGQHPRSVRWGVIRGAMSYCAVGVAVGALGALLTGRILKSFLSATGQGDVVVLAQVVAVFSIVSIAAAYIPARRASQIDPMLALRGD